MLIIEQSIPHDRKRCKHHIVHLVNPAFIQSLAAESREESEPKLGSHKYHIFVKIPTNQITISSIALTTMHEH